MAERLIDADALIVKYGDWYTEEGTAEGYIGTIKGIVDSMPTIEERKKGKWEQVEVNYPADMDGDIKESMAIASMFCPKCKRYHNEIYLYGSVTFGVNYCPNCGADMKGEGNGAMGDIE